MSDSRFPVDCASDEADVHKVFETAASNPQSAKVNETRERRDMPNRSLNADHHVMALGQTQRKFASCDMPIAEL